MCIGVELGDGIRIIESRQICNLLSLLSFCSHQSNGLYLGDIGFMSTFFFIGFSAAEHWYADITTAESYKSSGNSHSLPMQLFSQADACFLSK